MSAPPAGAHCSSPVQSSQEPPANSSHVCREQNRSASTLSRVKQGCPFVSRPHSSALPGEAQAPSAQRAVVQSSRVSQVFPARQRRQPPPQSTSVSAPFLRPSPQDARGFFFRFLRRRLVSASSAPNRVSAPAPKTPSRR